MLPLFFVNTVPRDSLPSQPKAGAGGLAFTRECVVVPVDPYPPPAGAYY